MSARARIANTRGMMWHRGFRQWLAPFSLLVCVTNCTLDQYGTSTALSAQECKPGEYRNDSGNCQPAGLPLDMKCQPGELELPNGTCQPAGLPPDMLCPPGELALENGGCQPAGVPPEMCGPGFEPDGKMGCNAILPADPCPFGLMAVPGETECHEVAPCGEGTWGDIPVDETTQYVNQAYAGNDSNGTKERPWKTIAKGIWEADPGAIVAIAKGTYDENLLVKSKSIQLWGVCPGKVTIANVSPYHATIDIVGKQSDGSSIHALAIEGVDLGVSVYGARDVTLDRVWIRDTGRSGVDANNAHDHASVWIDHSLIEQTHGAGIESFGADISVTESCIRNTVPVVVNNIVVARGIGIVDDTKVITPPTLVVSGALIENHDEYGIVVFTSNARIEATQIRDIEGPAIGVSKNPDSKKVDARTEVISSSIERASDKGIEISESTANVVGSTISNTRASTQRGQGIQVEDGTATIRASMIKHNDMSGVFVWDAETTIESTIIKNATTILQQPERIGIFVKSTHAKQARRASSIIHDSIIEDNDLENIGTEKADVTVEHTVVRNAAGAGVYAGPESDIDLVRSIIDDNGTRGLYAVGAIVEIDTSTIRNTRPNQAGGEGIGIYCRDTQNVPSTVTVRGSLVAENHEVGIHSSNSSLTIETTVVRATQPSAYGMGWGIYTFKNVHAGPSTLTMKSSIVTNNHAVGIVIEGSHADIESSVIGETKSDSDGFSGRGISIQAIKGGNRGDLNLRTSVVRNNHELGVFVAGVTTTIAGTSISHTEPDGQGYFGRGISAQAGFDGNRPNVTIRESTIENSHEAGIFVSGANATISDTAIRTTAPNTRGEFGDGIVALSLFGRAEVDIARARVERSARTSISSFGGRVILTSSVLVDDVWAISSQGFAPFESEFLDDGQNRCGCVEPRVVDDHWAEFENLISSEAKSIYNREHLYGCPKCSTANTELKVPQQTPKSVESPPVEP